MPLFLGKFLLRTCCILAAASFCSGTLILTYTSAVAFSEKRKASFEELVLKGNEYRMHDHTADARRFYEDALKLLDKEGIHDMRRALVLYDIAETYRADQKYVPARMREVESSSIYKKEIKHNQLGREYSSTEPVKQESGSLRPACYLCHENWKVVPIIYGEKHGYEGQVPDESDWKYTHKPGGKHISDQRWYCRQCHQAF